jgi:hypothetical protein
MNFLLSAPGIAWCGKRANSGQLPFFLTILKLYSPFLLIAVSTYGYFGDCLRFLKSF